MNCLLLSRYFGGGYEFDHFQSQSNNLSEKRLLIVRNKNINSVFTACLFYLFVAVSLVSLAISGKGHSAEQIGSEPKITRSHAIAMHGKPKYSKGFAGFEYTSAKAIKGGEIRLYGLGTFDSLNAFIAKGNSEENTGLLYDSLTTQALD